MQLLNNFVTEVKEEQSTGGITVRSTRTVWRNCELPFRLDTKLRMPGRDEFRGRRSLPGGWQWRPERLLSRCARNSTVRAGVVVLSGVAAVSDVSSCLRGWIVGSCPFIVLVRRPPPPSCPSMAGGVRLSPVSRGEASSTIVTRPSVAARCLQC
jgi:hypothetical protein